MLVQMRLLSTDRMIILRCETKRGRRSWEDEEWWTEEIRHVCVVVLAAML